MKILFITPTYYPHIGGVEYVVKSIAERLVKKGHDISVLAGEPQIEKPIEEWLNNVRIIRWPTYAPSNAYHIPRLRRKLEEHLKEYVKNTDVIHIHSIHSVLPVYCGLKLSELGFKGKLVATPYYHGTGHTILRRLLWMRWNAYARKLLKISNVITTVSKLEAELIKKQFGLNAKIIENGVEEWILEYDWNPQSYVMYSGRIEKYKNIHRLANIVKILNIDYHKNLEFKIYGNGTFKNKLIKLIKKLGIDFEINDFQSFEKYIDTLSKARLFGLISEKESYPQSVNEANAIGVPVVIAKPWSENFEFRTRTLFNIELSENDEKIAKKVAFFLEEAHKQPKPKVPSWSEVVEQYLLTYSRE